MAIPPSRLRRTRSPEVVFVSSVAILCLFALYSFGRTYQDEVYRSNALHTRNVLAQEDQECRFVHGAPDKCAFIRANCPDEEAGLISYLQLYYCSMSGAKPFAFAILVLWISLLFSTIGIAASDFLCINLSTIAAILGMSESLTGVTFLAFGNGSPDVFSTFAAMNTNSGSLAVGELMGAAGFITAVVAGSMALIKPFKVARKSFVRDVIFFTVAASFSLVFLADGNLRLWECIAMVMYYLFYVVFVVIWHWWLQRQRRRKLAEQQARLHHHIPEHEELEAPRIEIDEEAQPASERSALLRSESGGTINTLRSAGTPAWKLQDPDDDEEQRDRYLAELQSNMRLNRGRGRDRRNTLTPIRPSLIGALEFRSVLSALERKSTGQSINLRRYSDDSSQAILPGISPAPYYEDNPARVNERQSVASARNRAVSANDVQGLGIDRGLIALHAGSPETAIYTPNSLNTQTDNGHRRSVSEAPPSNHRAMLAEAYPISLSPLSYSSGASSPTGASATRNGLLAPPSMSSAFNRPSYNEPEHDQILTPAISPNTLSPGHMRPRNRVESGLRLSPSPALSPNAAIPVNVHASDRDVPVIRLPHPELRKSPLSHFSTPDQSPVTSRPASIRIPAPSMSPESVPGVTLLGDEDEEEMQTYRWWPYKYLPPPQVILSTLFPTLYDWKQKGVLGRVIGLITAPSVFLLTITLPIVDASQAPEDVQKVLDATDVSHQRRHSEVPVGLIPDMPGFGPPSSGVDGDMTPPHHPHDLNPPKTPTVQESPLAEIQDWSRWLVIVQLFTAPLFIVLIVWANLDDSHSIRELLLFVLGSTVFSLVGLFLLLLTTTSTHEPRYRPILCFLGFTVAIAWISTIANEVVGVLKAIGVILNISDAILGLTIFAVGNSLGDLVADITVAKLGFPVMALSACLGGPMLNILLGIGIGGMYMTISNGQEKHSKHPNKPVKYKPYELEVSTTLMISGITLLVTLCGLLIVVPLNGWKMDRKVGAGLITLWVLSTVGNVVCEILGIGEEFLDLRNVLGVLGTA